MVKTKITAIVSDYDGTLTLDRGSGNSPAIHRELEHTLVQITKQIPVCILSRSDYHFLRDKVPFANIVSCILGIETLVLGGVQGERMRKVKTYRSMLSRDSLGKNSLILNELVCSVEKAFPELRTARRFTHDGLLASITIDWRHLKNYRTNSKSIKEFVGRVLFTKSGNYSSSIFTQTYDSCPFLDVHSVKCDKNNGFDSVVAELGKSSPEEKVVLKRYCLLEIRRTTTPHFGKQAFQ